MARSAFLKSPEGSGPIGRRIAQLSSISAIAFSGPALASDPPLDQPQQATSAPKLISFDGAYELAAEASRVGMLSQVLTYTLSVGADGKPTDCEINRKFRRKYVKIALCRPMLKHHTFEPARDANGRAVTGTYEVTVDFRMFFNADGSSKAREV